MDENWLWDEIDAKMAEPCAWLDAVEAQHDELTKALEEERGFPVSFCVRHVLGDVALFLCLGDM